MERTAPELRIEAQAVLKALANRIGVDREASGTSFAGAVDRSARSLAAASGPAGAAPDADGASAGAAGIGGAVRLLAGAAKGIAGMARPAGTEGVSKSPAEAPAADGTQAGDWDSLEELIYRFDAHIQDTLTARSDTVACGYQLGRALAECYWALEPGLPEKPETWASWSFLLGQERCRETGRLLGRLSAYFHPYTAAAIAGSVQVWGSVAESPDWRQAAYPRLYDQIRRWYELILLKQDPTTLIQPYQLLRNYRLVWRTIRGFWPQLVLAALAAGAVAVFAWLLTKPGVSSAVKTLLAALGIAGFSVAGLAAKVQNEAQALVKRLKQDAYTDLIGLAITTAPLPPRSVRAPGKSAMFRARTPKGKMTAMLRQRAITPVTPN
jgi:hypothetical protein